MSKKSEPKALNPQVTRGTPLFAHPDCEGASGKAPSHAAKLAGDAKK